MCMCLGVTVCVCVRVNPQDKVLTARPSVQHRCASCILTPQATAYQRDAQVHAHKGSAPAR